MGINMKGINNTKGAAVLVAVFALVMLLNMALLTLYVVTKARIDLTKDNLDTSLAYYLCETAVSVCMLDFAHGKIGNSPGQWTERNFDYKIGSTVYPINYVIRRPHGGDYQVTTSVNVGDKSYSLTAGGARAFPIFIRGFAGGK
jgi:hypothetical protein